MPNDRCYYISIVMYSLSKDWWFYIYIVFDIVFLPEQLHSIVI